jgi:large-conductance mechanosensitive channel
MGWFIWGNLVALAIVGVIGAAYGLISGIVKAVIDVLRENRK